LKNYLKGPQRVNNPFRGLSVGTLRLKVFICTPPFAICGEAKKEMLPK